MPSLQEATKSIMSQPAPESLVALQGALLTSAPLSEATNRALEVTGHFYAYLSELQSKISSRNYSEMASRLDIGAVGAVALENIISSSQEDFWERLMLGAVAEGLMVAASRQYVKGWEVETRLVHGHAAWYLAEALWKASAEMQPDLEAERRWHAIQTLLAPAHDPEIPAPEKAVLLGRTFQMLLLTYLTRLLPKE